MYNWGAEVATVFVFFGLLGGNQPNTQYALPKLRLQVHQILS